MLTELTVGDNDPHDSDAADNADVPAVLPPRLMGPDALSVILRFC